MTDEVKKIPEPAIKEMLSVLAGNKVYNLAAPQHAVAPYIIYQTLPGGDRWRSINGPSGTAQIIMQISCYHAIAIEAAKLGSQVESILDGYMGSVYYGNDSPQDFVKIGGISFQDGASDIDSTEDPLLFKYYATYLITYDQQ